MFPKPLAACSISAVAPGALGEAIKQRQLANVSGIELDPNAGAALRERLDQVWAGDVEQLDLEIPPGSFDAIVCADILEHPRDPGRLLRQAREWLTSEGHLIASSPNVRHHSVVRSLLQGNWTYESAGLLDRTHLRFFTRREIEKLFHRAGFASDGMLAVNVPGEDPSQPNGPWRRPARPAMDQRACPSAMPTNASSLPGEHPALGRRNDRSSIPAPSTRRHGSSSRSAASSFISPGATISRPPATNRYGMRAATGCSGWIPTTRSRPNAAAVKRAGEHQNAWRVPSRKAAGWRKPRLSGSKRPGYPLASRRRGWTWDFTTTCRSEDGGRQPQCPTTACSQPLGPLACGNTANRSASSS